MVRFAIHPTEDGKFRVVYSHVAGFSKPMMSIICDSEQEAQQVADELNTICQE